MSFQPLMMNVISLLVIGYIARKLGTTDFGIFNFVLMFTMLFYPVSVMGLNRITVRDLSSIENKEAYIGKIIPPRILAILVSIIAILITAFLLRYEKRTVHAIYLGCGLFMIQQVSEILTDIITAFERMEFTALIRMVSGLTLTALSVIILFLGFGLYELFGVYAFGQFVGCVLAFFIIRKYFVKFRIRLDWEFAKTKFIEGLPFFVMTLMWFVMMRIDTIVLSKKVDMAEIGLYTSAIFLVTKLSILPQGMASALLPSVSDLYNKGRMHEISTILDDFLMRIILFVLPGVIFISYYGENIVRIMYGDEFTGAGIILRIGIWAFLVRCLAFIESSVLTAIHQQNVMLKCYTVAIVYCVPATLALIHYYQSIGAVVAFVSTQSILMVLFSIYTFRSVLKTFNLNMLLRILLLNVFLFLFLYILPWQNIFLIFPVASLLYLVGAVLLRLISVESTVALSNKIYKKVLNTE